jgi:hypothetical protein
MMDGDGQSGGFWQFAAGLSSPCRLSWDAAA